MSLTRPAPMCDRGSHLRALRVRGRKIHPAERSRLVRLPLAHRFFSLSGYIGSARKLCQKSTRASLVSNGLTSEIEPGCPKMDTMPGVSTGTCLLQKVTVPYHREGYLLIFCFAAEACRSQRWMPLPER